MVEKEKSVAMSRATATHPIPNPNNQRLNIRKRPDAGRDKPGLKKRSRRVTLRRGRQKAIPARI
jgi:hypothetical protein